MKTNLKLALCTAALTALCMLPQSAQAQIFVSNVGGGTTGSYNLSDGSTINNNLIPGADYGIAVSGSTVYAADDGTATVGTYNLDGTAINSSFITIAGAGGGDLISSVAVSGGVVYVGDRSAGTISEYNATNGAFISSFASGTVGGIVVDGSHLFVSDVGGNVNQFNLDGTGEVNLVTGLSTATGLALANGGADLLIGEYGSSSVADYNFASTLLSTPITGVSGGPGGLAINGSDVYIAAYGGGVSEYTLSGTLVANPLITDGLSNPFGIAIAAPADIPEPSTFGLIGLGVLGLAFLIRRHRTA